ncbi:restriction system-associated AAA family ATPase [Hymenobacter swuensis]|uniref:ATPase AAA-type core domain-containing protein n=1 Tax=Hymenobacter swuensis DY53 TaxID=1227739 RepID=W8ERV5_9BACT|nr:restriction system-associated AAA family ATPase [Hymenobacter swuensis]AHJ95323.1 hypothetical protein Hsw_PB0033 [Hymenobacter swuensis DY53]
MKLQYLKLISRYRSLEPFEQAFPKHKLLKENLDPIGLVGLNGSGKSNFLELIADIFFEVEEYFLSENRLYKHFKPNYFAYADNKKQDYVLFEIRYKITVEGKEHEVTISRNENDKKNILFYKKEQVHDLFNSLENVIIPLEEARKYIPLVIAYTSGLNDLLTLPFVDLQDYYARQVAKAAREEDQIEVEPSIPSNLTENEKIPSPNLLLLNYDSNAAIVVSNFLLLPNNKLKSFRDTVRIKRMNSFRINIKLDNMAGAGAVEVTSELKSFIKALQDCASITEINKSPKGDTYILDFIVNDATKKLFEEKFRTAQKLFDALTKLNLLNTLCVPSSYRNTLRKRRGKGQLLRFPQIASLDKIFSIEKIELVITEPLVRTEYEKLSDGEHQFIHIVGGILLFDEKYPARDLLYLLDEPDTHFNPVWRSTLFYELDKSLVNKKIEFVLTTHSPFILSDIHGYNVFKFERKGPVVSFERSSKETYGATFNNVIDEVFQQVSSEVDHFEQQIAKRSFNDIIALSDEIEKVNSADQWEQKCNEFEQRIRMLGDSTQKIFIIQAYEKKASMFKK